MVDGTDALAHLGPGLVNQHHERRRVAVFEIVAHALLQYRGSERPEPLPMLDAGVQDIFHVRQPGMSDNGSIAECTRPPLHFPLEPTDYLALGDGGRGA